MHIPAAKHICAALLAAVLAIGLMACGETVSTSSFKGEKGKVAGRISEFQSDATKGDSKTICKNDLAAVIRARLKAAGGNCQQAIKDQLSEIDTYSLSINSISITGSTASAEVKSTHAGKTKPSTMSLVREGKSWRISGLGGA